MLKSLSKWVERKATEQWISTEGVVPVQRYADGTFYLNSCAGLIKYRPKTEKDRSKFRDQFVNRFEAIATVGDVEAMFELYAEIRASHSVSYRANVRTRLKEKSCVLRRFL